MELVKESHAKRMLGVWNIYVALNFTINIQCSRLARYTIVEYYIGNLLRRETERQTLCAENV
jgi:hypothetical protein